MLVITKMLIKIYIGIWFRRGEAPRKAGREEAGLASARKVEEVIVVFSFVSKMFES